MPIIDFFDRGWASSPNAVAYCTDEDSWTFDEARTLSCQIGHALLDEGLQREGKVAVLSPNAPLAWICVLGVWRAGGAWVPLNPGNPTHENADLLRRFDVEVLFYDPSLADQVEEFGRQGLGLRLVALSPTEGAVSLQDWVGGRPTDPPVLVGQQMDDVVAISPTGGTTGVPKGVMNTHRSFSVMVVHQMLALSYAEDEHPVNLAAAPMTHTAGLFSLQTSARGGTVVVVPRATPEHILPAVEKHGITEIFLPPTVIYRLLDVLADQDVDTSSLKYVMYAAAPMSSEKLRAGIERLGPVFIECYGQVEAPAAITFMRPEEHLQDGLVADDDRLSSCGRPYPLVRVAVKDPDGTILAAGETGEICVQGDLVMKGYYRDPERTADTIRDGWLHTGDLGRVDSNGYLHLTDRKKDMIITGGFNVYPGEVEQVIWSHPAVEDCAVVGAPDADWGERVTAVVELKPGRSVDEDEVIALCRASLSGVKTPKQVVFIDRLPRSANGKVLKREVREQFWTTADRAI